MRQKKLQGDGKTLKMAFVFLVLIVLLIVGSFLGKAYSLFKKSLFDGDHRITIFFQGRNLEKDGNILISFAPDKKNISLLQIQLEEKIVPQKLSIIVGIPIDGFVTFSSSLPKKSKFEINDILSFLKRGIKRESIDKTDLTFFDFVRLWFFTKSIPTYEITTKEYSITNGEQALSDQDLDKITSSLFLDDTLSKEKVSIQIVNASGVSGLGNRLARLLTNSGGNIVSVITGSNILPKSEIAYTEKTYTLEQILKLVPSKTRQIKESDGISDIIITLGKDKADIFSL